MSRYKVLIDSSVWIEFFKNPETPGLEELIAEDLICTNEIVLCELIPFLLKNNKKNIVTSLLAVENIPLNINWKFIREYQFLNLKNGINKVGIPDLINLQQVIEEKLTLYSYDKHFKLMQSQFEFGLINKK